MPTDILGQYRGAGYWWKLFSPSWTWSSITLTRSKIWRRHRAGILDIVRLAGIEPPIVGEFGSAAKLREELGSLGSDPLLDPAGLHLHNGIWASAMTGAAGALPWFISN